jgi:glyoxylase-like metal-dependent hydrolase (beta-lactamase superfamily II)
LGKILDNLKAAGHAPEQVDHVLITHLHGDHCNGLIDAQGFFKMAQSAVAPYQAAGRLKTFDNQNELLAGIKPVPLEGHTPGHSGFLLESQGQRLLIWGDIVHNAAVQFRDPKVTIEFDSDPKQALATRARLLAQTAKDKTMVAGMHLAFPGIGHVRAQGQGRYEWVPIDFGPLPAAK